MSPIEILRLVIVIAAAVVSGLWIYYGSQSHDWLWTYFSLSWLVPVMLFFIVRFLFTEISPAALNMISLSLYLMGIASLGGVAVAKIKSMRERDGGE